MKYRNISRVVVGAASVFLSGLVPLGGTTAWADADTEVEVAMASWSEDASHLSDGQRDTLLWLVQGTSDAAVESTLERVTAAHGMARVRVRVEGSISSDPIRGQQLIVLADRYGITQLPAWVLLDTRGLPYAKMEGVGGESSVLEAALAQGLTQKEHRDRALAAAAQAQGLDRAQALHEAMQAVEPFWPTFYVEDAKQIIELDPDASAGLRDIYREPLVEAELDEAIQTQIFPLIDLAKYAQARDALINLAQRYPLSVEQRQRIAAFVGQLHLSEGDRDQGRAVLQEAMELDPASSTATQIRELIQRLEASEELGEAGKAGGGE